MERQNCFQLTVQRSKEADMNRKRNVLFLFAIIFFSLIFISNSFASAKWLSSITLPMQPSYPGRIALDSVGNIYVADSNVWQTLFIYDRHGSLKNKIGLKQPVSIAVDSASKIYIGSQAT